MQEAAEAIGISLAAARARLFYAKAALRRSPILKLSRRHRFRNQICNAFRPLEAGRFLNSRLVSARLAIKDIYLVLPIISRMAFFST